MITTPDTNVIIGGLKADDGNNSIATNAIMEVRPKDFRLLSEVYAEASSILAEKSKMAVKKVLSISVQYANEKGIEVIDLKSDDVKPIIDRTIIELGTRSEAFFHEVGHNMLALFDFGMNPFISVTAISNSIIKAEINNLDRTFWLTKSGNDLLSISKENTEIRIFLENELKSVSDSFFAKERNSRDLRIISELTIVCKENLNETFRFIFIDKDLNKALKRSEFIDLLKKYHKDNLTIKSLI